MKGMFTKIKWKIDYFLVYFLYNQNTFDQYYQYLSKKWHLKTTSINLTKLYWQDKLVTPETWYNLPDCKNDLDRLITLLKDNPDYEVRDSSASNHLCRKEDNIVLFRRGNEILFDEKTSEIEEGEIIIYTGCTYCKNPCFKITKIDC